MKKSSHSLLVQAICAMGIIGLAYVLGRSDWTQRTFGSGARPARDAVAESVEVEASLRPTSRRSAGEAYAILVEKYPGDVPMDSNKRAAIIGLVGYGTDYAQLPDLFNKLKEWPPGTNKDVIMGEVLKAIAKVDAILAYSLVGDLEDVSARASTRSGLLSRMAREDLPNALKELAKLGPNDIEANTYFSIFSTMTEENAEAASGAALHLPAGPQRDEALKGTSQAWARMNPPAALAWADSLPVEDEEVLKSTILAVAKINPKLAAAYVDQLADGTSREAALKAIVAGWANELTSKQQNTAATLDWLGQQGPEPLYSETAKRIVAQLATRDPAGAAALSEHLADPVAREVAMINIGRSWARAEPLAAAAWAQALPATEASARDNTLRAVVASWSTLDPMAAAAFVQNSADPSIYLALAPEIVKVWATSVPIVDSNGMRMGSGNGKTGGWVYSDPAAALAWTGVLPESAEKYQAMNTALTALAKTDFTQAWNYAESLPAGNNRDGAMTNLVGAMAGKNPEQAVELMAKLPSEVQLNATQALAKTWAQQDPRALSQWVTGLPEGSTKDTATVQLIAAQVKRNPAEVVSWANSISDPDLRAAQVEAVVKALATKDPAAAVQAAQSANLPARQRTALAQEIGSMRGHE